MINTLTFTDDELFELSHILFNLHILDIRKGSYVEDICKIYIDRETGGPILMLLKKILEMHNIYVDKVEIDEHFKPQPELTQKSIKKSDKDIKEIEAFVLFVRIRYRLLWEIFNRKDVCINPRYID